MTRDSAATRARILAAATDEFSAYGLAGGRVDRIAAAAEANKRAIYDYFGSKEGLFDHVVAKVTDDLIDGVPPLRRDLAAYAGALFDYLLEHPEAQRLLSWRRLERPHAVPQLAASFVGNLEVSGTGPGQATALDTATLIIGMANAWDLAGADLVRAAGGNPDSRRRIADHRAALVEAARRVEGRPRRRGALPRR